jgi:hypothetical protein
VIFFQYLYKKEVATILPVSSDVAMITVDIYAPENNIPIPAILKKAAITATNSAETPTMY